MWQLGASFVLLNAVLSNGQETFKPATILRCPGFEEASNLACVNRYAAVLPLPFERAFIANGQVPANDTFVKTKVPSDTSFGLVANSSFVLFDQTRGLEILGPEPKVERIFDTRNDSIHEAPVYIPGLNVIIFSQPHQGVYTQKLMNLNNTPPTIEDYTSNPPVYAVNGGKYHNGKVYWASEASFSFPSPIDGSLVHQAPGIYMLDPSTNKTTTLLNNYYGSLLNSPNDLWIDANGDIFFTDSWYGWGINVTVYPVHPPLTYRFRPSSGAVSVVEDSIGQPNGLAASPDGKTIYISDSGVTDFFNISTERVPRYKVDPFGGNAVYAFDVQAAPPGNYLINKRPIYVPQTYAIDGLHVSQEGFIVGAAGRGVDVLSEYGEYLMRIELPGIVNSLQFAGTTRGELWVFGPGGIFRISGLKGLHGMLEE